MNVESIDYFVLGEVTKLLGDKPLNILIQLLVSAVAVGAYNYPRIAQYQKVSQYSFENTYNLRKEVEQLGAKYTITLYCQTRSSSLIQTKTTAAKLLHCAINVLFLEPGFGV
jgi:hypothetical protein